MYKMDNINNEIHGNFAIEYTHYRNTGAMQDFSGGGGPNFKISGILDIHDTFLGGFGGMPPRIFLKIVKFRVFF